MQILWRLGEGSVKDVWQRADRQRELAYTTVMTVLDKMRRKGILKHRKKGKAYLYSPAIAREQVLSAVMEFIAHTYFSSSQKDFLHFATSWAAGAGPPEQSPLPNNGPDKKPRTEDSISGETEQPDIEEFLL